MPAHSVEVPRRRRLILIGASGSGKTVIARRAASRLPDWDVLDTDDEIKRQFGVERIKDIFEGFGEPSFRAAELKLARDMNQQAHPLFVATGGGLPAVEDAMSYLLDAGLTVFLRASVDTLWR